jgi:hypothetical protein
MIFLLAIDTSRLGRAPMHPFFLIRRVVSALQVKCPISMVRFVPMELN